MARHKKHEDADVKKAETVEIEVEKQIDKTPEEPVSHGVFVADGKHVNCRRGILGPGTEVFAKDFPGGEKTIAEHVENGGLVVK